ncbi:MAG: DUF447 domain-containing protein [Candidatus Hodarchaeota archaeon]
MVNTFKEIGLKEGCLYEILATTFSIKSKELIPNASCMGIRLQDQETIVINPYQNTLTYKNLKENCLICINFLENIYLYALAALKGPYLSESLREFPIEYYNYYGLKRNVKIKENKIKLPFVRDAWAILICESINESTFIKKDDFGEVNLPIFTLKALEILKFKNSHKFFNRAENLTLETIILTTKLKVAYEIKRIDLIKSYQNKIEDTIQDIRRFGRNPEVIKSLELVEEYIQNLKRII